MNIQSPRSSPSVSPAACLAQEGRAVTAGLNTGVLSSSAIAACERLSMFLEAMRQGRVETGGFQIGSLIDLVSSGRDVVVAGDLHARIDNFDRIVASVRREIEEQRTVLVFLGDLVHANNPRSLKSMDSSIELMARYMQLKIEHPRSVYALLGNHDFLNAKFRKDGISQCQLYREEMRVRYGDEYVRRYEEVIREGALVAIAPGAVCVHAGPVSKLACCKMEEFQPCDTVEAIDGAVIQAAAFAEYERNFGSRCIRDFMQHLGQPNGFFITGHLRPDRENWRWEMGRNYHALQASNDKLGIARVSKGTVSFEELM